VKVKKATFAIAMIFTTIMILGCASGGDKSPAFSQDKILSTSSDKPPDWVRSTKDMSEKDENLFFKGHVLKVYDTSLGLTQARSEAKKLIVNSLKNQIADEFANTRLADNTAGGLGIFSTASIAAVTGKVTISGILPSESYYEERVDNLTEERYYNCYALIKIARTDYNLARRRVVEGLIEIARAKKNQQAEQAAMAFKRKLESKE